MKRLAWLLIFCLNVHAQEPQDVVRISTKLVQVDAVVTKDGKPVTNLKLEAFEIFEDGRRQPITNFTFVSVKSASVKSASAESVKFPPSGPTPVAPADVRRTVAI